MKSRQDTAGFSDYRKMSTNSFYYDRLPKPDKQIYHIMLSGFYELNTSFIIPYTDAKTLCDIFIQLRLDHPDIFYVSDYKCSHQIGSDTLLFIPHYVYKKKQILEHKTALQSRIQKLIRPVRNLSDAEKEQFIHDFLCANVHYDKLKKPYSHEIIGPLGQGVGVCEGIAKTFKVLADALGIWCVVALGENNPEKGIKYRHTWNILQLNGHYYHVDATFDNSLSEEEFIRYDYFNVGDEFLFRDHEPPVYYLPACMDNSGSYYVNRKQSITKMEDVPPRAFPYIRKNKRFVFQWRGGYLTREIAESIVTMMREKMENEHKTILLRINWSQAVFVFDFVEDGSEKITIEQPDTENNESPM